MQLQYLFTYPHRIDYQIKQADLLRNITIIFLRFFTIPNCTNTQQKVIATTTIKGKFSIVQAY
jgi:hypothetical protein